MKRTIYCVLIVFMVFFTMSPQFCFAEQTLKIAFGNALPPWVLPETDSGIVVDLIKETLEPAGYNINCVYFPYARRLKAYEHGQVDVVSDVNSKIMQDLKMEGYFSSIAYAYENIGVALKERGYSFSTISELVNYGIVSWQGAKTAIGGEYAEMAEKNKHYRELPNQKIQVKLLYAGRTDLIQLDRQIFKYFRKQVAEDGKLDTKQPVNIFPLFGKNECGFLFRDQNVQETFDKNLALLKESGRYDKIFEKYTE